MKHPFAELIGLIVESREAGKSLCSIDITDKLMNPHHVVHGGVIYSLADTGMGAALYPSLPGGHICATIDIKISYFSPARKGKIRCETQVIHQGKSVAYLESNLFCEEKLIARAEGHYAIFKPSGKNPGI